MLRAQLQHSLRMRRLSRLDGRSDSSSTFESPSARQVDATFPIPSSTLILTPLVLQTGSPLFCVYLFENGKLHRLVGYQALDPRVLFFECSQPLGLADFYPSELSLPRMVGRHTDIVRRTDRPSLGLPASASRNIPIICFSPNRLFFISCAFLSRTPAMSRPPFGIRPNAQHILGAVCGDASGQVHCFILNASFVANLHPQRLALLNAADLVALQNL